MSREARGASRDGARRASRAAGGVRESAAASIALIVGLALAFLLLLADIEAVAYHEDAYRDSLTAGDTAVKTGLDVDDLLLVVHRVLDYATGRRPDLQFDLAVLDRGEAGRLAFTPRELEHMADVRELFGVARVCRWVALGVVAVGLVLLAWLDPGDWGVRVARGLRTGAVLSVLVCALLAAAAVVSFSVFWTAFHDVLFSNDLWLLPADSLLIRLMPEALFERLALEAVGLLTAELVAIIAFTSSYLFLRSRTARPAARPYDTLKGWCDEEPLRRREGAPPGARGHHQGAGGRHRQRGEQPPGRRGWGGRGHPPCRRAIHHGGVQALGRLSDRGGGGHDGGEPTGPVGRPRRGSGLARRAREGARAPCPGLPQRPPASGRPGREDGGLPVAEHRGLRLPGGTGGARRSPGGPGGSPGVEVGREGDLRPLQP